MKRPTLTLIALAGVFTLATLAPQSHAQDSGQLQKTYNLAKTAFHRGDYITARVLFSRILKKAPGHRLTLGYLSQINHKLANQSGNPALEKKANSTILKEVDIDKSSLTESIDYLILLTTRQTGDAFKPNIILKDLTEEQKAKTISLKLSNVPLGYTLKTVGELAGIRFGYEAYAIVGSPAERAGVTTKTLTPPVK